MLGYKKGVNWIRLFIVIQLKMKFVFVDVIRKLFRNVYKIE